MAEPSSSAHFPSSVCGAVSHAAADLLSSSRAALASSFSSSDASPAWFSSSVACGSVSYLSLIIIGMLWLSSSSLSAHASCLILDMLALPSRPLLLMIMFHLCCLVLCLLILLRLRVSPLFRVRQLHRVVTLLMSIKLRVLLILVWL